MIEISKFFNKESVCIFTDSSVRKVNDITYSSPSILIIDSGDVISDPQTYGVVLSDSTSNQGEIYAILLALSYIEQWKINRSKTINIFSDSSISIVGLKKWYESWLNNMDTEGIIYNSNNDPVSNQEIFLKCMLSILNMDRHINFYHVSGHMCSGDFKTAYLFNSKFKSKNEFSDNLSRSLIDLLIKFNDKVDKYSRSLLQMVTHGDIIFPKAEFLFKADSMYIAKEKRRYASLIY